MAGSTVAPTNKAVVFRGKPQKEFSRLYKRGMISDAALRKTKKKHSKFQKRAGHNPPKPEFSAPVSRSTYQNLKSWEATMEVQGMLPRQDPVISKPQSAAEAVQRRRDI